jgi:hypothetical protein
MDDVCHWFKSVNQFAISLSIIFEFVRFVFEELEDVIGRMAGLKPFGKGVFCRVYPGLLHVFYGRCIKDELD